jgi:hypothetical protein
MRLVLLVALALALAGCGSNSDNTSAPQPVTVTETVVETTTATTEPTVSCSTAGLRLTLPEQELPAAVAAVRKRIFGAAIACDYKTLEEIALEKGAGFTFSYGAAAADSPAAYWRQLEESKSSEPPPMLALAKILTMPYTRNETGSYAWPTAYSEKPTEEAWQALVDAGLYTQEQVDSMKAAGMYLGYRTAITPDGDWQFFVAGD